MKISTLFILLSLTLGFTTSGFAKNESSHSEHQKIEGVAPDEALKTLKGGNLRFISGNVRKDGQSTADIKRLSTGQKPHTIVLSCSDSRVPPEIVFDQKLGELFVVRTAGEVLDPGAIGSIEYAIEHLGARNILVMGHTSCGAVTAAYQTLGGKDAGSPNINKLVQDIHPRLSEFKQKPASKGFEMESWANAKGVAKDLIKRSDLIAKAVASGQVKISSSVYYLESGEVKFE